MQKVCALLGLLALVGGLGCDRLLEQLLHDRGQGQGQGGEGQSGTGGVPAADGGTGAMAGGPDGAAGAGGQAGGPGAACGAVSLGATIALAPSAAGQSYRRCQTLGPEAGWRVALSPAGDRLAARTAAGTVRLLATDSWKEVAQLGSPLGQLDAVAFSPDGATLAALSAEMGEVSLWSAADGRLQRSFAGPAASGFDTTASALAFSSDGTRLATSLGTVIDLSTGATTSWLTGAPQAFTLAVNPENLGVSPAGGGVAVLGFAAGGARLFVETDYQIGNSPTSTRLELRDPASGAQTVLYDFYSRALDGYALSRDGRFVARAATSEAAVQGIAAGLAVLDATTGTQLAFDPSFTGQVLSFSEDGSELFVQTGSTVAVLDRTDLRTVSQLDVPSDFAFLGLSGADDLVGSSAGKTSWWSSGTGAVVRTLAFPLTAATWAAGGAFGAGTGDPAALFHFWREADGAVLCGPPAGGGSAPALASLGTPGPAGENQSAASQDGAVNVSSAFVIHGHAASYDALSARETASGALLRQFGATVGTTPSALSIPSGATIYTSQGPDVAAWCR
ncbi:MAG TPA: WD40 repeat domain-containing protein [Polyangia bacterium]|nr:WD40 repeat domain-containing protein [Polyangia bacterium]